MLAVAEAWRSELSLTLSRLFGWLVVWLGVFVLFCCCCFFVVVFFWGGLFVCLFVCFVFAKKRDGEGREDVSELL